MCNNILILHKKTRHVFFWSQNTRFLSFVGLSEFVVEFSQVQGNYEILNSSTPSIPTLESRRLTWGGFSLHPEAFSCTPNNYLFDLNYFLSLRVGESNVNKIYYATGAFFLSMQNCTPNPQIFPHVSFLLFVPPQFFVFSEL